MLKTNLGDALIWMETAEKLYVANLEEFSRTRAGCPHTNALNVAAVSAGYAFELVLKVLVEAGGERPKPRHEARIAYEQLKLIPESREDVDRIIAKHGWDDPDEFLAYLDGHFCHGNRKYWMMSPNGEQEQVVFNIGGRKGMDALRKVHKDLSDLALKRINDSRSEGWPGIDQYINL